MVNIISIDTEMNIVVESLPLGREVEFIPLDFVVKADDMIHALIYAVKTGLYADLPLTENAFDKESTWHLLQRQYSTVLLKTEFCTVMNKKGFVGKCITVCFQGLAPMQAKVPADYKAALTEFIALQP